MYDISKHMKPIIGIAKKIALICYSPKMLWCSAKMGLQACAGAWTCQIQRGLNVFDVRLTLDYQPISTTSHISEPHLICDLWCDDDNSWSVFFACGSSLWQKKTEMKCYWFMLIAMCYSKVPRNCHIISGLDPAWMKTWRKGAQETPDDIHRILNILPSTAPAHTQYTQYTYSVCVYNYIYVCVCP